MMAPCSPLVAHSHQLCTCWLLPPSRTARRAVQRMDWSKFVTLWLAAFHDGVLFFFFFFFFLSRLLLAGPGLSAEPFYWSASGHRHFSYRLSIYVSMASRGCHSCLLAGANTDIVMALAPRKGSLAHGHAVLRAGPCELWLLRRSSPPCFAICWWHWQCARRNEGRKPSQPLFRRLYSRRF
ncbi:uncharacterized protein IWZ02DRAFT_199724 [Phyllosticta citriasiana]|uniref:uncharacterized protein n=1 Tax=Phyllosticta citriasiana TaxID=595635 RepID=UPI0030FDAF54